MRIMPVLSAAAIGLALGGCASVDAVRADGVPCVAGVTTDRVYLEVAYAADGTPLPIAECTVRSGTTVTWRTRNGDGRAFKLGFKTGNPDDGSETTDREITAARGYREFPSAAEGGRQKARIKAKPVQARTYYKYDIQANGKVLDPVIIIDPR